MWKIRPIALLTMLLGLGVFSGSPSQAQPAVNLTGTYECIQGCAPVVSGSRLAYVTQSGWDLNLITENGVSLRAWFDWFTPTTRIWIEQQQQGAVYSASGMTIQFDRGPLWRRTTDPEHDRIAYCARKYRSYEPGTQTYLGFDGRRHACP